MRVAPLSLLTACGASATAKVQPPPSLTSPCAAPVALPERALTQVEVETGWGRDRAALRTCGEKLAGLASFVAGQQ